MKNSFLLVLLLSLLASCSTLEEKVKPKEYHEGISLDHKNMVNQRIAARTGHDGFLVNQICKEFDPEGNCTGAISFERYDLRDPEIRKILNDFRFACYVGGKRFRISMDRPGLIRQEEGCTKYKKKLITRDEYCAETGVVKTEYLDAVEKYYYLIAGATECRSGY